ncbi:MAG: hypothetical protein M1834_002302 [Cirrosporium novae-zelandiae]|nr:MAG: hypothetical protein M1834_002302 [Cirrosporium novae-zelandiae]
MTQHLPSRDLPQNEVEMSDIEELSVGDGNASCLGVSGNKSQFKPNTSMHTSVPLEYPTHYFQTPDNDGISEPTNNDTKSEYETDRDSNGNLRNSLRTSLSMSSRTSTLKSSTPQLQDNAAKQDTEHFHRRTGTRKSLNKATNHRPRALIPGGVVTAEYARESVRAAYASRLNPYALHPEEYQLLRSTLPHRHVTTYLNIRNGILRLWIRNPLVIVTQEEATGCAKEYRFLQLAEIAYEWLLRRGYINFGCVEIPNPPRRLRRRLDKQKTIVVIGAGAAGLGTARQIQSVLMQRYEKSSAGEMIPKIIILEGRNRIGGRIYSYPLNKTISNSLPQTMRATAEMGAQIITGFEQGNPLHVLVRGQLALPYHSLRDVSTLYDVDGSAVDHVRDEMVEKVYDYILEKASEYRSKPHEEKTFEGNKDLVDGGRDVSGEDGITIAELEQGNIPDATFKTKSQRKRVTGVDKLTRKIHLSESTPDTKTVAETMQKAGWNLKPGNTSENNINLEEITSGTRYPRLGDAMDEGVRQFQQIVNLTPQDIRLINWHFANLEYANAVNVNELSLGSWDQDVGHEFEGEHSEVIGGYQQVPRGLWRFPTELDIRKEKVAIHIQYDAVSSNSSGKIICEDGDTFEADRIVLTAPLGVLKDQSIQFSPQLPGWKTDAISRLGFGLLNKVILRYEKAFWDTDRDMFGLLRDAKIPSSLNHKDYASQRGRFYLFWNCIKTSGCPTLIALMAGKSAEQCESTDDDDLIQEVTGQLRNMFGVDNVPEPEETIITRWRKDRFARGTYSYVGTEAVAEDYDAMARPIGNLYFAGEATCRTHPATVHGAYISGLRAASEVVDSLIGPIEIPTPLIPPRIKASSSTTTPITGTKRSSDNNSISNTITSAKPLTPAQIYEEGILDAIYTQIGFRPLKPSKTGVNPFLLFQKDHWFDCKAMLDTKAGSHEIRTTLGAMWRSANEEERRPYIESAAKQREVNGDIETKWKKMVVEWDSKASEIKTKYIERNPLVEDPK